MNYDIKGVSAFCIFFPSMIVSLVNKKMDKAQRVASLYGHVPAVASHASC